MKPAKFEYHAPAALGEAVALLQSYGGEARLLSGGQSLVPMLNFRLAAPRALVDLRRIAELSYVRQDGNSVAIGAMTRQRTAEESSLVRERVPLLAQALSWTGHLPTRSRGTVGGSMAHADPSAEQPLAMLTLGGELVVVGPQGKRTIAADDFFLGMFTTALEPDEILVEVRFPIMDERAGCAVEEFSRRKGDFAIVAIAAVVRREGNRCVQARLAASGVSGQPVRLRRAEDALLQGGLGETAIAQAASLAGQDVDPMSDPNGSAEYRRHLVRVLSARALHRAVARAA